MSGELDKSRNNDEVFQRIFGAGIGIVTLGAVAIISAPVAIPAIGFGLGAIGLGGALSGTAIGFGLVGGSAVVGGVVGGFSPDIYDGIVDLFDKSKGSKNISNTNHQLRFDETPPQQAPIGRPNRVPDASAPPKVQGGNPFAPIYPLTADKGGAPASESRPRALPIVDPNYVTRHTTINADFDIVKTPKQLLELVDHYRQSAIKKVVNGGGSFDEKKGKIEKIFQATVFGFNIQEKGRIKFQKVGGEEENLEAVKDRIRSAIMKDTDNFPLDVLATDPVKQDSFSDVELLHRMSYNRIFITQILDAQDEVDKDKALEYAFWQHKISGNELQYPKTLRSQKVHIGKIFNKDDFEKITQETKQDVDKHLGKVKANASHIYFPNDEVHSVYYNEDKRRKKIEDDFAKVTNNKQLLELVDHYRQFAIEKVANEGVSFDEKKAKIENIFKETAVNFNHQTFSMPVFSEDKKNTIKEAILKDPAFAVNLEARVVSSSLSETQLLKRILYNRIFIAETLGREEGEDKKQELLKSAILAYRITGDQTQYPKTFEAQKKYIDDNMNSFDPKKMMGSLIRSAKTDDKNSSSIFNYNSRVLNAYKEDQRAPAPATVTSVPARVDGAGVGFNSR